MKDCDERKRNQQPKTQDQIEELVGAVVGAGTQVAQAALETAKQLMSPSGSGDALDSQLPQQVSHAELVAWGKKKGYA
jgi:hypothetical protein